MKSRIETWATVSMAVVAIAVGGKVLLGPSSRMVTMNPGTMKLSVVEDTKEVERFVVPSIPSATSPSYSVQLIEFMDVECPFCSSYASTIDSIRSVLGDTVHVHVAHMPLRSHKLARPGAIAVECAFRLGVGFAYVSTVYRQQDSLGSRSWAQFANDAGLQDTIPFETCRKEPGIASRIESATAARTAARIQGTPTVWVNSWQYSTPPDFDRLLKDIRLIAAGGEPSK